MEDKICTITLADGTELENLTLNGENYVSLLPVSMDIFEGNCSPMIISDGKHEVIHENAEAIQVAKYGKEYWIAFRDIPAQELRERQYRADIDYIALMADIDLEEV